MSIFFWNIGGSSTWEDVTVKMFYERERGTSTGNSGYPDYISHPSEWSSTTDVGEKHNGIALIYPSDYGYATNGGSLGRETCFAKELYNWYWDSKENEDENFIAECVETDWLNPKKYWTSTLLHLSSTTNEIFYINSSGYTLVYEDDSVQRVYGVEPTAYLTKNVTITSGSGSYEQPYQLQLNA